MYRHTFVFPLGVTPVFPPTPLPIDFVSQKVQQHTHTLSLSLGLGVAGAAGGWFVLSGVVNGLMG